MVFLPGTCASQSSTVYRLLERFNLREAQIESDAIERHLRGAFVRGEILNGKRCVGIADDGHAIARG